MDSVRSSSDSVYYSPSPSPSSPSKSQQQSSSEKTHNYVQDFFFGCIGCGMGGAVYAIIAVPLALAGLGVTLLLGASATTVKVVTLSLLLIPIVFGGIYSGFKCATDPLAGWSCPN